VAEDVQGVTELLAAVLGAVVGGVIAYSFGKRQGRKQTAYEERARAVIQIRHKLREVQSKIYEGKETPRHV
jgi:hypothetical protein